MLTDEEIGSMWAESCKEHYASLYFARAIERAVLAKAGENPSVVDALSRVICEIKNNGNSFINVISPDKMEYAIKALKQVGVEVKEGNSWVPGFSHFYPEINAHPLPAQAIPEYEIIGYTTQYLIDDCKKGHQSLYGSWLREDCPKHDGVAIAVLSAQPKP